MNSKMGQDTQDGIDHTMAMRTAFDGQGRPESRRNRPMRFVAMAVGLVMMSRGVIQMASGIKEAMGASNPAHVVATPAHSEMDRPVRDATLPTSGLDTGGDEAVEIPHGYDKFQNITVESDEFTMSVDIPAAWGQTEAGAWELGSATVGDMLFAAPDIHGLLSSYYVPGLMLGASHDLAEWYETPGDMLDDLADRAGTDGCVYEGRSAYADALYTGVQDLWSACGEGGASMLLVAAEPPEGNFLVFVLIQMVSAADEAAAQAVLDSFTVE